MCIKLEGRNLGDEARKEEMRETEKVEKTVLDYLKLPTDHLYLEDFPMASVAQNLEILDTVIVWIDNMTHGGHFFLNFKHL